MANLFTSLPPEGGNYESSRRAARFSSPVASAFRRNITVIAIGLAFGAAVLAQVPDRSQAEALARHAADRMAALQREADALANQARSLLVELRKLEIDRQMKVEQLAQIQRESAEVQSKLAAAAARADALQGE